MENGSSASATVTAGSSSDASRSIMASSSGSTSSIATTNKATKAATVDHEAHQDVATNSNGGPIACNGCQLSLEETSDTVVVSFGEGLWHVDCRCAKCNNLVEHDTNLLLLADGSPVCEGCSYVCSFCGQSISNEAIVTGDESYHADCFRCKACSTRIEELVFAKTSQGIYCMACHNERVARTRKHAESKRNRSLRRNQRQGSSGQGSSSSRSKNGSSSHQGSASVSLHPDSRNGNGHTDGSISPASPNVDGSTAPNSTSPAITATHAPSSMRGGSGDADGNGNLPEPPASLKKLRGMDKSPRLGGDKDSLHPKPQDQSRLQTSPRHGQEALYLSPSASSDKTLPAIDGDIERSGSSASTHHPSVGSTRKPSEEDLSRTISPSQDFGRHNYPALNIPRATSPGAGSRSTSPTIPASSPTNTNFTQLHNGLAAPRANAGRNANRRSGFYGVMALPAGSPSPTGSGSVTPVLQDEQQPITGTEQDGYFANAPVSRSGRHESDNEGINNSSHDDRLSEEKALPVQPLAINRAQNGVDRNGRAATPSSSLSSVNTSGAGSSSSLSIPSASTHTPQTLSASSSTGKNNHLSFYDPDVLVFLDAVNDGSGPKRTMAQAQSAVLDKDSLSVHTPTRPIDTARNSGSSTMAEDGYNSDDTPDTTLRDRSELREPTTRSRSLSPNPDRQRYSLTPSPRQPRDLNLVANGHISTFSASTNDEDEEREMLSPLSTRRQSSGANNGLGLSTASSQRSNKSSYGVQDDDEEEDESTKSALRKVRESIRQSRGASMSSAGLESPAASASGMTLDIELVELLIKELEETKNRMKELQKNYNAIRRASRQAFEGFSMAREEYDREVQARRDAEYEMMRLKKELQEQASKLSALNQAQAQQEQLTRQSQDLRSSVVDIEQELRKMKIERELTYAELEELAATAKGGSDSVKMPERLSVAVDTRLSTLKETYRKELEALSEERDNLKAEVEELQQAKDLFNDESNELNKRNADISDDISEALKQLESVKAATAVAQTQLLALKEQTGVLQKHLHSSNPGSPAPKQRTNPLPPPSPSDSVPQPKAVSNLNSSVASSSSSLRPGPNAAPTARSDTPPHVMPMSDAQSAMIVQKIDHVAPHATVRKFKWGSKKGLERPLNASISKHPAIGAPRPHAHELSARQHNFQPISILRPVRCESCGDKMWGMGEQRCQACGIYCHSKCAPTFNIICNSAVVIEEPDNRPGAMSIFGNDLVAQCLNENQLVPTVVVKCIEAVEDTGIQYEGIYRKSGGMGQTKLISACFDRGEPFDLGDQDRFNDISAVTSVLKNYFRNLPNPLYTFEFHQDFCSLPSIKESDVRLSKLEDLLHCLPEQHYATLRMLMLHLHRIHRASSENKMTPANLGVVFGPTLLRSPDPSQEFSQMHLKARVVELTVENAPLLFEEQ